MSKKLLGTFPIGLDLTGEYIVQFTAVDSTTGAELTSVTVSNAALLVDNRGGGDLTPPTAEGEPEWINVPQEG